jgi:hypothetical protein
MLISAGLKCPPLHPAFGLDEDWNDVCECYYPRDWLLHPAFGLDEDWNYFL